MGDALGLANNDTEVGIFYYYRLIEEASKQGLQNTFSQVTIYLVSQLTDRHFDDTQQHASLTSFEIGGGGFVFAQLESHLTKMVWKLFNRNSVK